MTKGERPEVRRTEVKHPVCTPRNNNDSCFVVLFFLKVISLEGWTDIMYYVQDAHSFWDWIYFVLLIVVRHSELVFCFCFFGALV